jgi:hypothetical protein
MCSVCVAGALILIANTSFAQYNTAEIHSVVKDDQGGVLPGATVAAVHVASGLRVERTTDNAGRFFPPAFPVGEYSLSVELHGFKRFTQTGIVVTVGQTIDVPITLAIGQRGTCVYSFVLHARPVPLEQVEGNLEAQRETLRTELLTLKSLMES